jgi:hypothetical protein
MVFDRRFTAASPRYLGFSASTENRHRRAMPVTEHLCPLDPALLNGVRPQSCGMRSGPWSGGGSF